MVIDHNSSAKVSRNGNTRGGKDFSRGALYHLLSNPIYLGEIRHKHEHYPGQHEAIVSRELWDRVQQRLRERGVRTGGSCETEAPSSPLAGKLFEESGEPLYVQGAAKGQRRYRYYVSKTLVRGNSEGTEQGWRISAPEIEQTIASSPRSYLFPGFQGSALAMLYPLGRPSRSIRRGLIRVLWVLRTAVIVGLPELLAVGGARDVP